MLTLETLIISNVILQIAISFCNDEQDCYLRGSCQNNKCICDYWAIGENCECMLYHSDIINSNYIICYICDSKNRFKSITNQ